MTSANQEGLNKNIRSLEDEKRKLEEKIKGESERARSYEAMLRRIG